MRIHPSNCYPLERVVPEGGSEICGYFVPQGTVISMMAPVVNKAPSVFGKDAEAFRPERWLEADKEELKLMDRAFFTVSSPMIFPHSTLGSSWTDNMLTDGSISQFGHGSRACIGRNIANMEIQKLVPQILRHWKVEWTRGNQEWETHSLWFYQQKVHFKISSRNAKH